jgi:predicted nucleic acid-binding protein
MSDKTLIDTNVLIYAHDVDARRKHEAAKRVLHELWSEHMQRIGSPGCEQLHHLVRGHHAR